VNGPKECWQICSYIAAGLIGIITAVQMIVGHIMPVEGEIRRSALLCSEDRDWAPSMGKRARLCTNRY
jgi:hypothetical protein